MVDRVGYRASRSRYFCGPRLHLIATLHGLPVGFALTGAKADERRVLHSVLTADPNLPTAVCTNCGPVHGTANSRRGLPKRALEEAPFR